MSDTINILGGVSPLKARQSSRGGKSAGRATATSGRRGGFAKSTGKRGGSGRNVGGYNVQTRFVMPEKWKPPKSGGTTVHGKAPAPAKPYSYDKEGKMAVNPQIQSQTQTQSQTTTTPGTTGTPEEGHYEDIYETKDIYEDQTQDLDSYRKVWEGNKDLQKEYEGDFGKWTTAADKWWTDEAEKAGMSVDEFKETKKKKKKVKVGTEKKKVGQKYIKTKDATEGTKGTTSTQTQTQTQTQGGKDDDDDEK